MVEPESYRRAVRAAALAIFNNTGGKETNPDKLDKLFFRTADVAIVAAMKSFKEDGLIFGQHSPADIERLERAIAGWHDCYGG